MHLSKQSTTRVATSHEQKPSVTSSTNPAQKSGPQRQTSATKSRAKSSSNNTGHTCQPSLDRSQSKTTASAATGPTVVSSAAIGRCRRYEISSRHFSPHSERGSADQYDDPSRHGIHSHATQFAPPQSHFAQIASGFELSQEHETRTRMRSARRQNPVGFNRFGKL